jgi:hypothetical protein
MPIHEGQPIDPVMHIFCMRLAFRLAEIIQAVIRPEEIHDVVGEYYKAIREDLQRYEESRNGGVV